MARDDDERRRYFRIKDEAYLEYRLLEEKDYKQAVSENEQRDSSAFTLSAAFASLNNEISPVMNSLRQSNPDIAQYLEFLNNKIDALGTQLLEQQVSIEDHTRTIDLSASGIAFSADFEFQEKQPIEIKLVLLPEKVGVICYGRAMHKQGKDSEGELIGIDFEHIRDDDRELIIKHNLNRQMQELRERNEQLR